MQTTQQQKNYRYFGTLRRLLRRNAGPNIRKIVNKTHPADLAQILSYFPVDDQLTILTYAEDNRRRAEVLRNMPMDNAAELVVKLDIKKAVDVICEMSADDQADLLGELDEAVATEIINAMPQEDSDDVQDLLRYDERSAGGIMNPDVMAIHMDATIAEAIKMVQGAEDVDMIFYMYVVDDHNSLCGVLSLRRLVTAKPATVIKNIMNPNVVSVRTEEDQEDVARLVTRYDFLAIPVVDDTNNLVGAVTVDDVIDVIAEEATEDFLKMAGAGDEHQQSASPFKHVLSRAPWLFAALVGGILASFVISSFEETLSRYLVLAAFIPVIIGMAGNVGTQSLAVVVRGLATRQIKIKQAWNSISNEIVVGIILGCLYGAVLGAVGLWKFSGVTPDAMNLALAVGAATATAMCLAAFVASSIPIMFAKLNIDPAVATGPFVTTAIDILGVTIYFTVVNVLV
ncbi:MAG: magnesium transporter [Deltaproteobacteria bacterium]|nr:magnesium transporter [Deltaproteobacteria bacterium]MBN2672192.1 magnesium transporter [Deltaproteobacteria bacterium]